MLDLHPQTDEKHDGEQAPELVVGACPCGADLMKTGFVVKTTSVVYQGIERVGGVWVKSYRKKSMISASVAECALCHAPVDVPAQLISKAS